MYLFPLSTPIPIPAPSTNSSRTPNQFLRPISARAQSLRPTRRIGHRTQTLDQRLQTPPHHPTPRIRRVVIDREHAHGAQAPTADDGRLPGQGAVAVHTRVCAGGGHGAVAKQARRGIVDGGVDVSATGHARLDERRIDAGGVREGGDFGVVDREAVAEWEEAGRVGVLGELVHESDGELGVDGRGVGVAGGGGFADLFVGALGVVAAGEGDRWEGPLDGCVGGADGAGEGVEEGT